MAATCQSPIPKEITPKIAAASAPSYVSQFKRNAVTPKSAANKIAIPILI